jgi:putative selenium metabolism protein SsnA
VSRAVSDVIVSGGTAVAGTGQVVPDAAVAIRGNRIVAVGPASVVEKGHTAESWIDASGKLVMPGLINAHTHLYSALARGLLVEIEPSCCFTEILDHLWWRLDRALAARDVTASARVGAIDLIRNGTTTIVDHHASQVAIEGSLSRVADALADVGLRANLCFEVTDREGREVRDAGLAENERFAKRMATLRGGARGGTPASTPGGCGGLLSASMGLHASFTLEDETLERASGIAAEHGMGCHIHAAEDRADVEDSVRRSGKRVIERLLSFDVLGPASVAAHCIHIDEGERAILKETGTNVVHSPQSNMNNAVGCAAVPTLLDEGVLVGLGTDGFTASMLDELKVANLIHRHEAGDPGVGHGVGMRLCFENNPVIASRLVGDRVGVLEEGALADIIVLDYDPPTPLVSENLAGHVIFGLTGWMVETVIIDGRIIMRDRELLTVDGREVAARGRERARELWKRM